MAQATRLITADELLHMPDDGHRYELVEGRLLTMSPAGPLHSVIALRLAAALAAHVDAGRLGLVLGENAGFRLASGPDTVRAPDASFLSRERIPPSGPPETYWQGAPDLAVEVMSPSDRRSEINDRIAQYLRLGVREVWFVEPRLRRLTICRPERSPVVLQETDTLDGGDLLPGFEYQLSRLFTFDF
jgi:Uma2 family endonuclease